MWEALLACAFMLDVPTKRALRATAIRLHHPLLLSACDALTLVHARVVYRVPLRFLDAVLAKQLNSPVLLEWAVWEAVNVFCTSFVDWGLGLPPLDASTTLDALTTLVAATGLVTNSGCHDARPVCLGPYNPVYPDLRSFFRSGPERFVAMGLLQSVVKASCLHRGWESGYGNLEGDSTLLSRASISALEWVVPRVPEDWLKALPGGVWRNFVTIPRHNRGTTCHMLNVLPKTLWTCFADAVTLGVTTLEWFGRNLYTTIGSRHVFDADVDVIIEFFMGEAGRCLQHPTFNGVALPASDGIGLLLHLMTRANLAQCDLRDCNVELLIRVCIRLYPEYPARILRALCGNGGILKTSLFCVVEKFVAELRRVHCQTIKEWTVLWKHLLQVGCCAPAVDVMAEAFPPDIWFDDAHLCRFALSLPRSATLVFRRLFGPRALTLLDLAKHPRHRDLIGPLMCLAKKASTTGTFNWPGMSGTLEHCDDDE